MTEEELKKQNEELQAKLDNLETKFSTMSEGLETLKEAKADLVKQRDDYKKREAASKDAKDTDNATVEQLKELLKEEKAKSDEVAKGHKDDTILSKLEKLADKAGFVKDKFGNVNMKLLKSVIGTDGLMLDDEGNLLGAETKFAKLKESDSYFFNSKKAPGDDKKIDPKTVKGLDMSEDGLRKMTFQERVKAMNVVGKEAEAKEKANGLPPGMGLGNATDIAAGAGSEPAKFSG